MAVLSATSLAPPAANATQEITGNLLMDHVHVQLASIKT